MGEGRPQEGKGTSSHAEGMRYLSEGKGMQAEGDTYLPEGRVRQPSGIVKSRVLECSSVELYRKAGMKTPAFCITIFVSVIIF